ncbi:hypothetical protein BGX31_006533 [Mortierella sp. GBA43]|nr:hypothetical protein BGX31_006533 [Mortierella sp. GBA43]
MSHIHGPYSDTKYQSSDIDWIITTSSIYRWIGDCIAVLQQLEDISVSIENGMDIDPQSSVLIAENHRYTQQRNQLINQSSGGVNIPGRLKHCRYHSYTGHCPEQQPHSGRHVSDASKMMQNIQVDRNRHLALQHDVRALLRQIFELHEHSTPRLFVILPKPKRKRDKILKPFKKQYKLFFLCQGSSHSVDKSNRHLCKRHGRLGRSREHPYKIHLENHEGYDVENVDKLFEKCGSHVVNIMKILKIGLTVSGIAVPGISHFVQGMESVAQTLGPASRNIGSLLEDSIRSLRTQVKGDNALMERVTTVLKMDFSQLIALKGADLRQLGSFLRNHDPGNVFGNLSRITDSDGHVR